MKTSIRSRLIGEAWLSAAREILAFGRVVRTPTEEWIEIKGLGLTVEVPILPDATIDKLGDPEDLHWMRANFRDERPVEALGNARSYAHRLRSYGGSKNQIEWLVERIRANPLTRSATITTLEPLMDQTYVPCISLLDFDAAEGQVDLYVYARSLDFGRKAYGNLVCLVDIQTEIAEKLGLRIGTMTLIVKSAHVYSKDWEIMRDRISAFENQP